MCFLTDASHLPQNVHLIYKQELKCESQISKSKYNVAIVTARNSDSLRRKGSEIISARLMRRGVSPV